MKVTRKSDSHSFVVYDIQNSDSKISFLIYDSQINKWQYESADNFIPMEEEYFG